MRTVCAADFPLCTGRSKVKVTWHIITDMQSAGEMLMVAFDSVTVGFSQCEIFPMQFHTSNSQWLSLVTSKALFYTCARPRLRYAHHRPRFFDSQMFLQADLCGPG